MKRRTKILLSIPVALLLAVVVDIGWYGARTYPLAQQHRKYVAERMKDLRLEFPVGTLRSAVMVGVDAKDGPSVGESDGTVVIDLGSEPSLVWYCSRWQSYAVFRFDSVEATASLENIELETRGVDCL